MVVNSKDRINTSSYLRSGFSADWQMVELRSNKRLDTIQKKKKIITKRGQTEGLLVDQAIPIYVLPNMPGGFELWQGARELIPNSTLCIGKIPNSIENTAGVILYWDQICTGKSLLANLKLVKEQGIQQVQIRVITAVASSQGLKDIGELFPELTIYAACIDPEITETNELVPGIGNPLERLNTRMTEQH